LRFLKVFELALFEFELKRFEKIKYSLTAPIPANDIPLTELFI